MQPSPGPNCHWPIVAGHGVERTELSSPVPAVRAAGLLAHEAVTSRVERHRVADSGRLQRPQHRLSALHPELVDRRLAQLLDAAGHLVARLDGVRSSTES
jgi:hypothetical protein